MTSSIISNHLTQGLIPARWENYVIAERIKFLRYHNLDVTQYFWRTNQQQEIDLIEDDGEQLTAFEFKWSTKRNIRFPQTFTENYRGSKIFGITPYNVEEFLM